MIVSTNDNRDIFMLHEEPSPIIKFCPLNSASQEECGPLVHIQKCGIIPYTNVRKDLIEEPTNVYKVVGDGNCYFRCISYALSGKEDYHDSVQNILCDYISWFPGRLSTLIIDTDDLEDGDTVQGMSRLLGNTMSLLVFALVFALAELHNMSQV